LKEMDTIISSGYVPGAIGRITELHATYYSKNWNFRLYFEAKVATGISEFLNRFDPDRDGFWLALLDGEIIGSIVIDGIKADSDGAHLRWFIVDPDYAGKGIGGLLIDEALEFCRKLNYRRVYLWTFQGLDPARHLYEKNGFKMCKEHEDTQWGVSVLEQMFELQL
jgi:GNAT superfamily N-acetyltransferase